MSKIIKKKILTEDDLLWSDKKCVTVVLASGGYPESYEKGKEITGLNKVEEDIIVFHGGTKLSGDKTVTDGGRVLAVTSMGSTIEEARSKVYHNIPKIKFDKIQFRSDIAK